MRAESWSRQSPNLSEALGILRNAKRQAFCWCSALMVRRSSRLHLPMADSSDFASSPVKRNLSVFNCFKNAELHGRFSLKLRRCRVKQLPKAPGVLLHHLRDVDRDTQRSQAENRKMLQSTEKGLQAIFVSLGDVHFASNRDVVVFSLPCGPAPALPSPVRPTSARKDDPLSAPSVQAVGSVKAQRAWHLPSPP